MNDARMPVTVDGLLDAIWNRLEDGARSASHPFHTACLATGGPTGVDARTVVLRRADPQERRILCHTDTRSAKAAALAAVPDSTWVFYDAAEKLQLRARGPVTLHREDALADAQWAASGLGGRRCYLSTGGPGAVLPAPGSGLPDPLEERPPTAEESEDGRPYFLVVACRVEAMDWLALDSQGHRRVRLAWQNGEWEMEWITP